MKIFKPVMHSFCSKKKSSRRDEVSARTITFLKIVSQNAPDFIPGWGGGTPLGGLSPSATQDLSPE